MVIERGSQRRTGERRGSDRRQSQQNSPGGAPDGIERRLKNWRPGQRRAASERRT